MAAWVKGFGVSVKPYALRYFNEWEVVPLGWCDDWVETANETAVLPVAVKSLRGPNQVKIMQKRTGTRTTYTDWKHDIHEPVNPGSKGWCQNTLTSWSKSPPCAPRRHGNLWLAVAP